MCVCVCVCVCARACVCACLCIEEEGHLLEYDITAIAEKHNLCDGAFFSHGTTSYRPGPVVSHTLRN